MFVQTETSNVFLETTDKILCYFQQSLPTTMFRWAKSICYIINYFHKFECYIKMSTFFYAG